MSWFDRSKPGGLRVVLFAIWPKFEAAAADDSRRDLVVRFITPVTYQATPRVELVPAEDHRRGVDLCNAQRDALLEFVDRFNEDVSQERARHLGEGALYQIEPGTMLGCVKVLEAPWECVETGNTGRARKDFIGRA